MPVKQNPAYLPPTLLVQCERLSVCRRSGGYCCGNVGGVLNALPSANLCNTVL